MTTKSELAAQLAACRRELAERRRVGDMFAKAAFWWRPSELDRARAEWDAIAREE
jgi:hypothetical protein